ncbi:MAG: S9 family peptidase [Candidatus Sericytochromatia bacterium]|nr:S9 family peptidase [Candidatus Sericytochromatia bacterium]
MQFGRRPAIEQFYAIRKTRGLALSADGQTAAFVTNITGTPEVWTVPTAGGWPHQLTFGEQAVQQVLWADDGESLIVSMDHDGDEDFEIFRVPRAGGIPTRLHAAVKEQTHLGGVSPDGSLLAYASNQGHPASFDILLHDLRSGEERVLWRSDLVDLPLEFSPCGRWLLAYRFEQNANQDLLLIEVATGEGRILTPHEGLVRNHSAVWIPGSASFLFLTDRDRDFMGVGRYDLDSGNWTWAHAPECDVMELAVSADGRWWAFIENRDGHFVPVLHDPTTGARIDLPEYATGVASEPRFSRDGRTLAFCHESPVRPRDVHVLDLAHANRPGRQITFSQIGGLSARDLVMPETLRFPSFDGLEITGWLFTPRGEAPPGGFPAIIWPHGGPDAQVIANFQHWFQVFAGAGYVVLAPNFRGSTGYGKAFQALNRRDWGGASFRDIVAGADHLVGTGIVDPTRVSVVGGSFGGFMALTAATREPDKWGAVVDIFGISNLFTFIETTPAWWKPYLHQMVGHPEEDRALLEERSPINFIDQVKAPILVIQGANDARVVKAESDQVVERLRSRGGTVEYLVFEDEGHGFSHVTNEIQAASAIVGFLDRHMPAAKAREAALLPEQGQPA